MKPPAPVRMWAVVRVARGGQAVAILSHTIRWYRADAIAAYDEMWVRPGEYARSRRRGEVRVARLLVSVEGEG